MPHLPDKKTIILLFLVAFVLKFLTALFIRYLLNCLPLTYHLDDIVIKGHDYFSYNGAMENYIQTGKYYFFNGKKDIYAGRLPHYSLLYLFFRQFLNIALANFMVVVVQIALECAAIVLLSLLAVRVIRSRVSFYLTYGLCLLSWAISFYSIIVLPDNLSVSFLIFFIYFFYVYLKKTTLGYLLLAGLFIGLVVVLKPYFSLLYLVAGIFFLPQTKQLLLGRGIRMVFIKSALFAFPLLVFLLPWIVRNYGIYNRVIPFQVDLVAGYDYTKADLACREYLQTFGEDLLYWDESSAGHYFKTCRDSCSYRLPAYVFTPQNNKAAIAEVRTSYQALQQNYDAVLDEKVAEKFKVLKLNYAHDKPLRYYFGSRLVSLHNFLLQGGPGYLPINKTASCFQPFHLCIYYLQDALYWGTLTVGFIGLLLLGRRNSQHLLLLSIPIYLIVLFPLILRFNEGRYLLHSYPFLLVGLVYMLERLYRHFKMV